MNLKQGDIKLKGISINPIAELIITLGIVRNSSALIVIGEAEREKFEQDMNNFPYGNGI